MEEARLSTPGDIYFTPGEKLAIGLQLLRLGDCAMTNCCHLFLIAAILA